ncbi:hypothetical protein [Denitrobaculum tricleocarpae]|uniref:Uncharacterized protein n=1 Tax=Denitrobaculum tricleocarpae TaxID=2591009 RepID=A0A545U261_9PROT|nr:hypothetical protein [Denitrobaculum tricleocarpae]TQV83524.1 hypothetical protein FKG95_02735 [Denitrobaculum tricleocarpae]
MNAATLPGLMLAILVFALGAARPSVASEDAEASFTRYQQAIEVTKQCLQIGFSDGEYERMGEIINEKVGHKVGAKRLSLLLAAQKDARNLVESEGCDSSQAQELIKIYDAELK